MNKCYAIILVINFFLPAELFAQINISGQLRDLNNKPIDMVEVLLQNKDSSLVKSQLTNIEGKFTINTPQGNYILLAKQLGKILHTQNISANQNLDLGIIKINSNQQQLQEVVVNTKKPLIERKVDRLIFNVENSISATGGDAVDALKVTPGIRIQNDKITMIGKSGMAVMIDDKLILLSGDDLTNFLKTVQASNIKSIEVITTPPAKYDAEGNSGLVNIVLKKVKLNSWNGAINSAYKQATYATGTIGSSFNYQKNKVTLFSTINYFKGSTAPLETSKIFFPKQLWSNNSLRRDFSKGIGGRLGIDYQLTKKWIMGIQYLGNSYKPNINENNLTTITNNTNLIDSFIKTDAINLKRNNSHSFNYHIIYDVDTSGTKISTDFDYFNYMDSDDRTFKSNTLNTNRNIIPNTYFALNNGSENNFVNYSAKIDVDMPLKWFSLTYGGKLSSSTNRSNVVFNNLTSGVPIFDPNQSNVFKYQENINAFYFSSSKKISDKWETQAGLRFESTKTNGNSITLNQQNSNNYSRFFPTAYLTYTPNENNAFSLNYSKRINRPGFFSLNPFRWYSNPYSYAEGNPFLQPSFAHNLEFSFTRNKNWENKIYYSTTNNGYQQLTSLDINTNIEAVKYENYFDTQMLGLSESYTYNTLKWWESVNMVDISFSNSISKVLITNSFRRGFNTYFSTSNSFTLNSAKTILFNFDYWLNTRGVSDLDIITGSTQLNLALKLLFFDKNLQLGIVGNDVLSSNRPTFTSNSNGLQQIYKNYYDIQYLRVTVNYKFGNSKINVEKRDLGNEDEKSRTN